MSWVTPDRVEFYVRTTPFSAGEVRLIASRYEVYDNSPGGVEGIWATELEFLVPEFAGHQLVRLLARSFAHNNRIYLDQFFQILTALCSRSPTSAKRDALWRSINPYHAGAIGMPELFDLYRSVFGSALGDDNIAILADRALNSHFLQTKGRVTREDLDKLIPDYEILHKLTIDLQL